MVLAISEKVKMRGLFQTLSQSAHWNANTPLAPLKILRNFWVWVMFPGNLALWSCWWLVCVLSFQRHSSPVNSWLSPAGQNPNLNIKQKSNFFFPNLEWWPVNLKTFFCYIFSPSGMQFPDMHPLLSPAGRLTQTWGKLAVISFMPCRLVTWTWWEQCGTVLVSLPQHPDCSELSDSGPTCVTEYTHSLL